MRRFSILSATAAIPFVAVSFAAEDPVPWRETTRDVYVDGRLRPEAIVLRHAEPERLAIVLDRSDRQALVVDTEGATLSRLRLEAVRLGERGFEAEASAEPGRADGHAVRLGDAGWLVELPRTTLAIVTHDGRAGVTPPGELLEAMPSWQALFERHEPDPTVVDRLRAVEVPAELTLVLGTWCGDSKREVPPLLKALDVAGNAALKLEVVTLDRDFAEPAAVIRERRLTNVPTLLVARDGVELDRVVETPAGASLAADLADILERRGRIHRGRWSRGAERASGRYALLDPAGREQGVETWELFDDAEGGSLLHATADGPRGSTEVWHRRDADGRTTFVEITRGDGEWHSRSRYWVRDGGLTSLTRGNGTGVIRQRAGLDPAAVVLTTSIADRSVGAWFAARSQGPVERPVLVLGGAGEAPVGDPRLLVLRAGHPEPMTGATGTVPAVRVAGRIAGTGIEGWLTEDLGLAVRWRDADGNEALLTRLDRPAPEGESVALRSR